MQAQCKQCGRAFERSDDLAELIAGNAVDNLVGSMPPTAQGRYVVGMLKGLLAEGAEDKLLSLCANCEPGLALIRLALEAEKAGDQPPVILLKFLLEMATKPQQQPMMLR